MGRRASILGMAVILVVLHAPVGNTPMAEELMCVSPDGLAPVPTGSPAVRGRSFVPLHSTVPAMPLERWQQRRDHRHEALAAHTIGGFPQRDQCIASTCVLAPPTGRWLCMVR